MKIEMVVVVDVTLGPSARRHHLYTSHFDLFLTANKVIGKIGMSPINLRDRKCSFKKDQLEYAEKAE